MSEDMNAMDMMKAFKITLSLQEHLFQSTFQMLSLSSHSQKSKQDCHCSCKNKQVIKSNYQSQSISAKQTMVPNLTEDITQYQAINSYVVSEGQSSSTKLSDDEKIVQTECSPTTDVTLSPEMMLPVKRELLEDESTNESYNDVQFTSTQKIRKSDSCFSNHRVTEKVSFAAPSSSFSGQHFPYSGKRLRNQERIGQQYRKYDRSKLDEATRVVLEGKMTAYKASLLFKIPCSTIHDAYVRMKTSFHHDDENIHSP